MAHREALLPGEGRGRHPACHNGEAFYIARSGRPGPVLIDIPKDCSNAMIWRARTDDFQLPGYKVPAEGDPAQTRAPARMLREAKRPVLLVGHGAVISGAGAQLRTLAETMHIPVTNTLLGKGAFPETHPLSLGMLGMHGTALREQGRDGLRPDHVVGSRWTTASPARPIRSARTR